MNIFKSISRTVVLALAGVSLVVTSSAAHGEDDIQLGIQTWSLRNMKFDEAVDFAIKHGIKTLAMSVQFDPVAAPEENLRKKAVLEKHGLVAYTFGVAKTSLDKKENRKLFETAKLMGMKMIVVEPQDFKIFDQLEELVREYDIRIAVHNHGIRSLYGNPAVLKNILLHRDARMGVCLDTGWITAAGFNAAKVFKDYEGRVFDIHLKDKKVEAAVGEDIAVDTHIGQGNADLTGLMTELKNSHWKGVMAIETDSPVFAQNPTEFIVQAKKFFEASNH